MKKLKLTFNELHSSFSVVDRKQGCTIIGGDWLQDFYDTNPQGAYSGNYLVSWLDENNKWSETPWGNYDGYGGESNPFNLNTVVINGSYGGSSLTIFQEWQLSSGGTYGGYGQFYENYYGGGGGGSAASGIDPLTVAEHTLANLPTANGSSKQVQQTCVMGSMEYMEKYFGGTLNYSNYLAKAAEFLIDKGLKTGNVGFVSLDIIHNAFSTTDAQFLEFTNTLFHGTEISTYQEGKDALDANKPIFATMMIPGTSILHQIVLVGYQTGINAYQYYDPAKDTKTNWISASDVSNMIKITGSKL